MARVANCPQCAHELLVPDEAVGESWAKCPQCRAFFQLREAAARELPAAVLVESPPASEQPAPDSESIAMPEAAVDEAPAKIGENIPVLGATDSTSRAAPVSGSSQQDTAERIDEWFRSSKTVADSPRIAADDPIDLGLGNLATDDELELEDAPSASPSAPPWEDAQHMERLLADVEKPSPPAQGSAAPSAREDAQAYGEAIAGTSANELPVFSKSRGEKPRRKRSLVRTVAVMLVAGVIGLALGYYALLWLRGPSGDFLNVAQYLPSVVLPSELAKAPRALPPDAVTQQPTQQAPNAAEAVEEPAASAEVQASFTTSDEVPAASQESPDRYEIEPTEPATQEPAPLDEQAAAPIVPESKTNIPQPSGAPSFSPDELHAALEAAREAQPALVTGSLEDGRAVLLAKGRSYERLADLAQKYSFVEAGADAQSVAAARQAAQSLFQDTLSDAKTRSEVAVIVPKWVASQHRKHGGIFFAASLAEPQAAGSVVEFHAQLDSGHSLPVVVPPALADRVDESSRALAVIGWLVERPRDQIPGYTGAASQAVWASELVPLP